MKSIERTTLPAIGLAPVTFDGLASGAIQFQYTGDRLGEGGFGRVDKVRVTASKSATTPVGTELACKRLSPKWNVDPAACIRLEREINALHMIAHPNIMTHGGRSLWREGGQAFYVMPLCSSSLRRLIADHERVGDWGHCARHGIVLAEALHHAHERGFVHGDLKPENVLLNGDGSLVIADWGLGCFVNKSSSVLRHAADDGTGAEYYCSSEQWNSGKTDARTDIYSLGMILDECVTGRRRTIGIGMGVTSPTVHEANAGAERFDATIARMTQPLRSNRSATMSEVADGLRAALAGK